MSQRKTIETRATWELSIACKLSPLLEQSRDPSSINTTMASISFLMTVISSSLASNILNTGRFWLHSTKRLPRRADSAITMTPAKSMAGGCLIGSLHIYVTAHYACVKARQINQRHEIVTPIELQLLRCSICKNRVLHCELFHSSQSQGIKIHITVSGPSPINTTTTNTRTTANTAFTSLKLNGQLSTLLISAHLTDITKNWHKSIVVL